MTIDSEASAREWLRGFIEAEPLAESRLETFGTMIADENLRQNLISKASMGALWRRHIVDSAQLLMHVPAGASPWLDLGTGAGFPGLIVAILRPETEMIMVEARTRRAAWLQTLVDALRLPHARIRPMRLEQIEAFPAAVISARAFAPLSDLVGLSARFSTAATTWVLPKGRSSSDELGTICNWSNTFHVERSITDPGAGIITGKLLDHSGGEPVQKGRRA